MAVRVPSSRFDAFLSRSVGWEIAFRFSLWICVAVATGWLAVVPADIRFVEHFASSARTLMPILRQLGTTVLYLVAFAILLKELEVSHVAALSRDSAFGKASGVVRRIASDLCLWLASSSTTLLSLMGIAVLEELRRGAISEPERSIVLRILLILGLLIFGALLGHVLLKLQWSLVAGRSWRQRFAMLALYAAALAAISWLSR